MVAKHHLCCESLIQSYPCGLSQADRPALLKYLTKNQASVVHVYAPQLFNRSGAEDALGGTPRRSHAFCRGLLLYR
jgi:hypothetical protein